MLRAFCQVSLIDRRVLVLELDLIAALIDVARGAVIHRPEETVLACAPADRQIARGRVTGVEVLVPGPVLRDKRRARSPVDPLVVASFSPVQRVARAADDDDVSARPVAVRLLVGADRELRDVGNQRRVAELEMDIGPTATLWLVFPLE